jgi:hypothetical protein
MSHRASLEVICPCCGAKLIVDPGGGKVLHSTVLKQAPAVERDLEHASQLLKRDAARRDSLFRKSMAEQGSKSEQLERKFEEALKKGRNDFAAPPVRDVDLD